MNNFTMTKPQFYKLIQLSTALMLQDLYDKEVIDNIANELSDLVLELITQHGKERRLTSEKETDTL